MSIAMIIWITVGYYLVTLLRKGVAKMPTRWKLEIALGIFMPLTLLTGLVSGVAMVVAGFNLVLLNWGPFWMSLAVAALSGAGTVGFGLVASHFDDQLRLIDGRGPFKQPVYAKDRPVEIAQPDPLYATWDQIIGFHTVDKVVADLPDSIRADFTQCSPFREATSVELAQAERVRGSIDRHVYAGGGMV